jgi:hypothetical protein
MAGADGPALTPETLGRNLEPSIAGDRDAICTAHRVDLSGLSIHRELDSKGPAGRPSEDGEDSSGSVAKALLAGMVEFRPSRLGHSFHWCEVHSDPRVLLMSGFDRHPPPFTRRSLCQFNTVATLPAIYPRRLAQN